MNLLNKILSSVLALGFVLFSCTNARAAEEAEKETSKADGILFRIENIKPLKNKNNLIDRCSFYVTVYNRTAKELKSADLELTWKDNISAKYKVENGDVVAEKDEAKTETVITKVVKLEGVAPHTQKSFKDVVETDKCFLLLDQVEYKVPSCFSETDKVEIKDSKMVGNGTCGNLFDYINSKNPEYYSQFKDVPESVLEKQSEEEKNKEMSGIEDDYNKTLDNLKKINDNLNKIK